LELVSVDEEGTVIAEADGTAPVSVGGGVGEEEEGVEVETLQMLAVGSSGWTLNGLLGVWISEGDG
jgi:hypothetical protein